MNENSATRLIAALHSRSWFRHGECPSVAETRQGGRQRCKLGNTIFNVLYAKTLVRLRNKLLDEDVLLDLPSLVLEMNTLVVGSVVGQELDMSDRTTSHGFGGYQGGRPPNKQFSTCVTHFRLLSFLRNQIHIARREAQT